jgi:site-specific recombinase XerD
MDSEQLMSSLSPLLQSFFVERLAKQRRASPQTVAAYRDCFKLLVAFAVEHTGTPAERLELEQLDAVLIGDFLEHLEHVRGNSVRTRNARLAAIHSLYRYAALGYPELAGLISRVLAIPQKRFVKTTICFLANNEIEALLATPDPSTWIGRRDRVMLLVAIESGLRVSELTALKVSDVVLSKSGYLCCEGKGRKQRSTPITSSTASVLKTWMTEHGGGADDPLFPTRTGSSLGRSAVEHLLAKYTAAASQACPSLRSKNVTPHVLRHTAAMRLLQAGVSTSVIALWLGHEGIETTQIYLHADMTMKERALDRTTPPSCPRGRYRPPGYLMAFLDSL